MSVRKSMLITVLILMAFATTCSAQKNEVVYANLSGSGDVKGVYIVNRFDVERATDITDYGVYESVVNLTDLSQLDHYKDKVSFSMSRGTFFYQGNMSSYDLPWIFSLEYRLDGASVAPDEIVRKSGNVELDINIKKNGAVNTVFFDNYMLSMSVTLNGDVFTNVSAPDATIANSGKDKLITYTLLPGNEKKYTIKANAENFEMNAISINAVPFGLDIGDIDTSNIKDKLDDMESGISSINKGADKVHTATKKFYKGTDDLYSGSVAINAGIVDISSGSSQLASSSGSILTGVNLLSGALKQLQSQALILKNGGGDLSSGAQSLKESIAALESGVLALKTGGETMLESVKALSTSAGSCTDEIKLIRTLLTKGAANSDVKTYLSNEMKAMTKIISTLEALDDGLGKLKTSYASFNDSLSGVYTSVSQLKQASSSLYTSISAYTSGVGSISDALNSVDASGFTDQFTKFDSGISSLNSAISTLKTSYANLNDGIKELYKGAGELKTGAKKLDSGTGKLKSKTGDMDQKVDEEVDEAISKFTGDGFQAVSFVDPRNDVELVQFVLKIDSIEADEDEITQNEDGKTDGSFIDRLLALFDR